jgi:quercetin dioxygenase-like cupin family protein
VKWSRRNLSVFLPALPAAQIPPRNKPLASTALRHEDIPVRRSGALVSRQMLRGDTHTGYTIDLHESELAAGEAPHPPHHHVHEELLLIREGLLDVTIAGQTTRLGPGSVAFLASNQEHGWRNAGDSLARYFVLALGDDKT